ncbi:NERD domain-containing protein [Bacillus kwashiorkori]|uniref:NERD domain-containing protein n=1 Tax=Bacillus kwashiorkori TaxID=1522318 RepID=UPI00078355FB|nr:NERD domain-containing protein [Bacillus kwashiorkori]
MGQLVKLQDYISRYELDIYRYPPRFIKLKREQWQKLKHAWETEQWPIYEEELEEMNLSFEKSSPKFIQKLKMVFNKQNEINSIIKEDDYIPTSDEGINIFQKQIERPQNLEELKNLFLQEIFETQMIWASSTITEKSYIDSSYYREEKIKLFLQRFPDTFLLFYRPVFLINRALFESEIILLSPTDLYCISFLEAEDDTVFVGSDERFWEKRGSNETSKIVNPLISLTRTENVIRKLLQAHNIDFPIQKILISRSGYIDYSLIPFGTTIVDKRTFRTWFETSRKMPSPLKHMQLKVAKTLLDYCHTVSVKRQEWSF